MSIWDRESFEKKRKSKERLYSSYKRFSKEYKNFENFGANLEGAFHCVLSSCKAHRFLFSDPFLSAYAAISSPISIFYWSEYFFWLEVKVRLKMSQLCKGHDGLQTWIKTMQCNDNFREKTYT